MTAQPETRFRCDRCDVEINVVLANTPSRMDPPEGWIALRIGGEMTTPITHLCGLCLAAFGQFMGTERDE